MIREDKRVMQMGLFIRNSISQKTTLSCSYFNSLADKKTTISDNFPAELPLVNLKKYKPHAKTTRTHDLT